VRDTRSGHWPHSKNNWNIPATDLLSPTATCGWGEAQLHSSRFPSVIKRHVFCVKKAGKVNVLRNRSKNPMKWTILWRCKLTESLNQPGSESQDWGGRQTEGSCNGMRASEGGCKWMTYYGKGSADEMVLQLRSVTARFCKIHTFHETNSSQNGRIWTNLRVFRELHFLVCPPAIVFPLP
jgi:hypothetical protein